MLRTLRWGEICWIIQVTPKYHNKCLHKRETGKFHHTHASTHAGEGGVKVEQGGDSKMLTPKIGVMWAQANEQILSSSLWRKYSQLKP